MKVCDLQERFGSSELYHMDEAENKVKIIGYEEARVSFPNVSLSQSENVCYFPFRLCHSIPKVNSRGRTYMPAVLQKSFHGLVDQVLDYEHQLVDNNTASEDRIIGHVKSVRFDGQIPQVENNNGKFMPSEPMPVIGLGCLYKRAKGVAKILEQAAVSPQLWRVSMECNHDWADAYLWYGKEEFIPIGDAPSDMVDCIGKDFVKSYKGKELAVCIGGMDREINMLGAALTTNPADRDADVLGFVTGMNRELCSRKIFHMPICPLTGKAREVASAGSQRIKELSSIAILGWTEEGGMDKHKHMVLSDGTIMPADGHHHCTKTWTITPGRRAMLSGVTEVNYDYVRSQDGDRTAFVHNHLFSIDLTKKAGAIAGTTTPSGDNGNVTDYSASDLSSATVTIGESEMKLQDLLKELAKELATASASTAAKPEEMKNSFGRLNELADKFRELNADEEIKSRVSEEIDKRIASGQLVTKEKADAAVAEAKTAAETTINLEKKRLELVQQRREKCREAGINLDFPFEGLTNAAGKPMTVGDRVDGFGVDEQGERDFLYNFGLWKKIAEDGAAKEKEAQQAVVAATQAKEAASARPHTMHLAGGGPSENGNGNSSDLWKGFGKKPEVVRKDNGGAHLLTR